MFDIMEERVTLVESLEKKRQPFPDLEVIYILAPSDESISRVIEDFKGKAAYGGVHMFFLSKASAMLKTCLHGIAKVSSQVGDGAMKLLQGCPSLVSRIKSFKELYVNFLAVEPLVFHLDERCVLPMLNFHPLQLPFTGHASCG